MPGGVPIKPWYDPSRTIIEKTCQPHNMRTYLLPPTGTAMRQKKGTTTYDNQTKVQGTYLGAALCGASLSTTIHVGQLGVFARLLSELRPVSWHMARDLKLTQACGRACRSR